MKLNSAALTVIRERSGHSISSLAKGVGIDRTHLSGIESGRRNASDPIILKLAQELKVPVTAIIQSPDEVAA